MPMIELTAPAGSLTDAGRKSVQRDLAALLLKWEGAPDNEFFRSVAWTYLHELPTGAQTTAEDDAPRFRVDVRVPAGALSDRRKAGLVQEATALVLEAAGLGEADALRVWVLIHEQPEGTWGAGGQIVKFADLKAAAQAAK
ncbi:Phenylpyruvate tautomerase PptA, 4-oxalocrotonate tautomerase family [Lentzea waywayandensis]|uniref:Phenylpyruvate tautomerase PptA, 4-oxalocrotonate tautomerase family n=2 Tax=Lentzea waywayandensis TaxID=84724 RepID=A0A1I6DW76_9PSEU|nr:Phenylpyruvate tautomerase PptA, 4-oxalocrotonate tautomerase family [Lentzea waywayandensis]